MSPGSNGIPDGPPADADRPALAKRLRLPPPAERLLAQPLNEVQAVMRLMEEGFEVEGVRVLAHVLPIRRAVWWAVLGAWHAVGGEPAPNEDKALASAVNWLRSPTEANREAAEHAAGDAHLDTAAGCAAAAAGLAGSVTGNAFQPRDLAAAAALAAQAISLAVSQRTDTNLPVSLQQLLQVGMELLSDRPLDLEPARS